MAKRTQFYQKLPWTGGVNNRQDVCKEEDVLCKEEDVLCKEEDDMTSTEMSYKLFEEEDEVKDFV